VTHGEISGLVPHGVNDTKEDTFSVNAGLSIRGSVPGTFTCLKWSLVPPDFKKNKKLRSVSMANLWSIHNPK
jgi:hypothetical protein